MSKENRIDSLNWLTDVKIGPILEMQTLKSAVRTTLTCQTVDQIQTTSQKIHQNHMLLVGIVVESALTISLKMTEKDVLMTALTLTVSFENFDRPLFWTVYFLTVYFWVVDFQLIFLGNTDDLVYFEWTDMIEGETLTVQVKEPCADGYIHPEWVGDSYLDFIKAEMMDDCLEGCDDSDNAEVCATKCKALTPRGKGDSVSHI